MRNSWGTGWGEDGYIRMAIKDGDGMCGVQKEVNFPNIYYMKVFDQSVYVVLCFIGAALSLLPLVRLAWCKSEEILYLHEG